MLAVDRTAYGSDTLSTHNIALAGVLQLSRWGVLDRIRDGVSEIVPEAELLDKLASVIRGRYKFQRKVNTLSAEGRLAAWVMSLFPFVLGGILSLINPDLMPMLIYDPTGQKLIIAAFVLMVIGIFWMQRIVRIDV